MSGNSHACDAVTWSVRWLLVACCAVGLVTACSATSGQPESTTAQAVSTTSVDAIESPSTTSEPGGSTSSTSTTSSTTTALPNDSEDLSSSTWDLLDGSTLEVVGPSELQLRGYGFTIEVPGIRSSNVDLARGVDPANPASVDEAAVLESDFGNGIRLWRADREGQPLYMSIDLGGWAAFFHVGNETAPDTKLLLSLANQLNGEATEHGVVLDNYEPDLFVSYLSDPRTENQVHLLANRCFRETGQGVDVVEDPMRGQIIRGPGYASWCNEDANIEVAAYGDEAFIERILAGMTLHRSRPQSP